MSFNAEKPYNDLPQLPPRAELETKNILKLCIAARAALAELRSVGELVPNQGILINTIPVLEAQASSEIENIVTTSDRLFQLGQIQSTLNTEDSATKEAFRYRNALSEGFHRIAKRPVTTETAIVVCSAIKGVQMEIRRVPGTALANNVTKETVYTPPEGETVLRDLLSNWEKYLHSADDVDPLVRMAVGHYQFEAIHPFTDGNGRTGRILNILYLIDQGLLAVPVLYLSRYILANRTEYYRLLQDVTKNGAWEAWIEYMVKAVLDTARWTTHKIRAIQTQIQVAKNHIKAEARGIYSHELLDVLFTYPYCRIEYLVQAGIVSARQTSSNYLKTLCEIGVLHEIKIGRDKLFVHANLQRLLTTEQNDTLSYTLDRSLSHN